MAVTKISILETGYFYADGGAMFGVIPKTAWERRYPCDDKNYCVLAMRILLVFTDEGRIILVDNGAGKRHMEKLSWYRFFDTQPIDTLLAGEGIRPDDITDVVLTHLHFDHCGHCTWLNEESGCYEPYFRNADYWVGKAQWENYLSPHPLEAGSFFPEDMMPVWEKGALHCVKQDARLCDGVFLSLYNGHTAGQLVPILQMEQQQYIYAGDVIPVEACLSPAWISAYDMNPAIAYDEKIHLLEKAVEAGAILIYGHDAYVRSSRVKKVKEWYKGEKTELPGL